MKKLLRQKTLYKVSTTFLGSWEPTEFYFDTKKKAEGFLSEQDNGEISKVTVKSDYKLDYSDGCSWNDLVFSGYINHKIIKEVWI